MRKEVNDTSDEKELPLTEASWVKLVQERRLLLAYCADCGRHAVVPSSKCKACGSSNVAWKDASGKGTIYSYTITFVPPPQLATIAPYCAAVVDLEEGARVNAIITGVDAAALPRDLVGAKVELDFLELDGRVLLAFRRT
ncbi:MAG: hypothetical protein Kow0069_25930 [Promethearchaeota archaeon]